MKIDAQSYEQMKAWFARMIPETILPELITPETHPVACLEAIEARWPAKARDGLTMAIGDTIEQTDGWSPERVAATDEILASDGLPTLSEMRVRFSTVIKRVVNRGSIKNDIEYYAVRNAAELTQDGGQDLWPLLSAYEHSQAR
jgi:hypothetical protein